MSDNITSRRMRVTGKITVIEDILFRIDKLMIEVVINRVDTNEIIDSSITKVISKVTMLMSHHNRSSNELFRGIHHNKSTSIHSKIKTSHTHSLMSTTMKKITIKNSTKTPKISNKTGKSRSTKTFNNKVHTDQCSKNRRNSVTTIQTILTKNSPINDAMKIKITATKTNGKIIEIHIEYLSMTTKNKIIQKIIKTDNQSMYKLRSDHKNFKKANIKTTEG